MSLADATASDGKSLDLDSLPQSLSYTDGKLDYVEVTTGDGSVYRQSFTWTGDDLTGISVWVKQ
jgi:hypothetical protein